ncbi:hypothetical protein JTB14_037214 [Gonioctena quinquepunctata]|nr:hypothetical protein JTB14_037214 [Gonioctena quinquepunctata]
MGSTTIKIILCILLLKYTSALLDGERLERGEAPYQAAIFSTDNETNPYPTCTGALVSRNIVITTALCVRNLPIRLILGATNISQDEPSQLSFIVNKDQITIPPESHGVAFIKLPYKVRFNEFIESIEIRDSARVHTINPSKFTTHLVDSSSKI